MRIFTISNYKTQNRNNNRGVNKQNVNFGAQWVTGLERETQRGPLMEKGILAWFDFADKISDYARRVLRQLDPEANVHFTPEERAGIPKGPQGPTFEYLNNIIKVAREGFDQDVANGKYVRVSQVPIPKSE